MAELSLKKKQNRNIIQTAKWSTIHVNNTSNQNLWKCGERSEVNINTEVKVRGRYLLIGIMAYIDAQVLYAALELWKTEFKSLNVSQGSNYYKKKSF